MFDARVFTTQDKLPKPHEPMQGTECFLSHRPVVKGLEFYTLNTHAARHLMHKPPNVGPLTVDFNI